MAINNDIRYSDNLDVYFVRMETKIYEDIAEMINASVNSNPFTVLSTNYAKMGIDGSYFSPFGLIENNTCSIYRKTQGQLYFDWVCTLNGFSEFRDYNIHNNDYYEYMAATTIIQSDGTYTYRLHENKDDQGNKIFLNTNWNEWSICNIDYTTTENVYRQVGDTWLLGLNLEGEGLTQNLSITSWDTLGRYPKLSMGEKDYISGSVTCLLGKMEEITIEGENKEYRYTERLSQNKRYSSAINHIAHKTFEDDRYGRELEKYIAWKKFCADGSLKLLKDIKGNAWIVQITSNPEMNLNVQAFTIPTTITFAWSEVLPLDEVSIIA